MNAIGDFPPTIEIRYHTVPAGHVDSYPLDMLAEVITLQRRILPCFGERYVSTVMPVAGFDASFPHFVVRVECT